MSSKLCIIPARGGSKRIPRKNVKNFLGHPMISYSIRAAEASGVFDEIMVSTDDETIAETAREYGAQVPFLRSSENSNAHAIINDVLVEVLDTYKSQGKVFDYVCILFATAPLASPANIRKSFDLMIEKGYDSIRPIVQFSYPIQRAFIIEDDQLKMKHPENYKKRSQDLEPCYHDSGQFYWINKGKSLLDTSKGGLIISEMEAQDIDTSDDWKLAELKFKILNNIS